MKKLILLLVATTMAAPMVGASSSFNFSEKVNPEMFDLSKFDFSGNVDERSFDLSRLGDISSSTHRPTGSTSTTVAPTRKESAAITSANKHPLRIEEPDGRIVPTSSSRAGSATPAKPPRSWASYSALTPAQREAKARMAKKQKIVEKNLGKALFCAIDMASRARAFSRPMAKFSFTTKDLDGFDPKNPQLTPAMITRLNEELKKAKMQYGDGLYLPIQSDYTSYYMGTIGGSLGSRIKNWISYQRYKANRNKDSRLLADKIQQAYSEKLATYEGKVKNAIFAIINTDIYTAIKDYGFADTIHATLKGIEAEIDLWQKVLELTGKQRGLELVNLYAQYMKMTATLVSEQIINELEISTATESGITKYDPTADFNEIKLNERFELIAAIYNAKVDLERNALSAITKRLGRDEAVKQLALIYTAIDTVIRANRSGDFEKEVLKYSHLEDLIRKGGKLTDGIILELIECTYKLFINDIAYEHLQDVRTVVGSMLNATAMDLETLPAVASLKGVIKANQYFFAEAISTSQDTKLLESILGIETSGLRALPAPEREARALPSTVTIEEIVSDVAETYAPTQGPTRVEEAE